MPAKTRAAGPRPAAHQPSPVPESEGARERRSSWRTLRKVAPYLWPADKPWVKNRVLAALGFLLLAKLVGVGTPFVYKAAVDVLTGEAASPAWLLGMGAVGITVAYGVARAANVGFQ